MDKKLVAKIKKAPSFPGVYRFLDTKGKPIYIGKAGSLKARLRSYLTARRMEGKVGMMLQQARTVQWTKLASDIEALLVESNLIKKHLPRWNVLLRDDKNYFFVHITADAFPRIYLTHQPNASGRFIGPFTDGRAIKTTLGLLREIFPYCTCSENHKRACLNSQIGKCPGYCCHTRNMKRESRNMKKEYAKNIEGILKVLKGQTRLLIGEMKKKMKKAAGEKKFEEAARLRDRLQALESIFQHRTIVEEQRLRASKEKISDENFEVMLAGILKAKKPISSIEMIDVANIQGVWAVGGLVRFEKGRPNKQGYRLFKIKGACAPHDPRMIAEVLSRRLGHPEWPFPDLLIVDGGITQFNAANYVLQNQKERPLLLASLSKPHWELLMGEKRKIPLIKLPTALRHLFERMSNETHRFTNAYYRKLHRKSYTKSTA